MNRFLRHFFRPIDRERAALLEARSAAYPSSLKVPTQSIGQYNLGCGATHGVYERCNFGCTACYLGPSANQQPPMPFAEVDAQLRTLRDRLGPGANIQITSGEVTLLPVADLVRIVKRVRELRMSPMVMTHGDVLLQDPAYLDRLVTEGGLDKISFHVDITQRGRKGISRADREEELNPVRDRVADLLRDSRQRTGKRLRAATTLTVNRQNLGQLRDPIAWFLANTDSFRILSFQPQADTGRTRSGDGVSADEVWQQLEAAVGTVLEPHSFRFGHRACNRINISLVIETGTRRTILQTVRPNNPMDQRFAARVLKTFGGLVLASVPVSEGAGRILGRVAQRPGFLWHLAVYGTRRLWQERALLPNLIGAALRGHLRIRSVAFIVHAFMSREELDTDLGRERLAACTFKLAVDGELVSMCQMNGTDLREATYAAVSVSRAV